MHKWTYTFFLKKLWMAGVFRQWQLADSGVEERKKEIKTGR